MVPLTSSVQPESNRAPNIAPIAFDFLNHLRFVAMGCRAKPRADLFKACALLHFNRSDSVEAHADALMRCLAQALGKPARLHAPGTAELTFDESWLVQLKTAVANHDESSLSFLLRSRIVPEHRRLIRFLICHISEHFPLI